MSGIKRRFKVYDTETTGLSHHNDQIIQFAGLGVDENLNLIPGDELVIDVKLRPDVVPSPHAFAVHGISIKNLMENGITEFDAAAMIKSWMMPKGSPATICGYNTQRFDDEVIRNTFYRTLLNPYEHEWKNGNSRADVMRLVMLVFGLRPEILNWPVNNEGRISLKLGDLARENGITLDNAHDARYDVLATIDLMRKIKEGNPKMWSYFLQLSNKDFVKPMVEKRSPLVLIDPFLSREQGHMTMVLPIIYDQMVNQKMICIDLRQDPSELFTLSAEEMRRRLFTPQSDLSEGEAITSIRDVSINKQPLIVEQSVFKGREDVVRRAGLDLDACHRHAEMIQAYIEKDKGFRERLQQAHLSDFAPCEDVYQGIYSLGFIGRDEEVMRSKARLLEPETSNDEPRLPVLVNLDPFAFSSQQARDPLRLFELTLRAKWANFSDQVLTRGSFSVPELKEWSAHLQRVWFDQPTAKNAINMDMFRANLNEVRSQVALDDRQETALKELEEYVTNALLVLEGMKKVLSEKETSVEAVSEAETDQKSEAEPEAKSHSPESEAGSRRIEAVRKNREARHPETGVSFP